MENLTRESHSIMVKGNGDVEKIPVNNSSTSSSQAAALSLSYAVQCAVRQCSSGHPVFPPSLSQWATFQEIQAYPQVPMIGRKNSTFPLSSQGHVKSVLLESRKVLALSVGSRCHETWEMYFGSFDKAAKGLPMFPKIYCTQSAERNY